MKNPFATLSRREWLLWILSLTTVVVANLLTGEVEPVAMLSTLVGVTALIFVAKGDVLGQVLTVV
ncbi:MAG: nicotinamide riboside transporter PnuC, partial [Clostridia bacterium]|nr:nicotinamide riboside transporter PnuC [Clostridia bacterium]